jgi:hypothetical protein
MDTHDETGIVARGLKPFSLPLCVKNTSDRIKNRRKELALSLSNKNHAHVLW